MPRVSRELNTTPYFHVMVQGINKSFIFEYSEDIKYFIRVMYKLEEQHKIKIIAYCIMNNHAHILVKIDEIKELSKYMQRLNTIYAKHYNDKYERVGYVFRDRYKAEGIYTEKHLHNCIKYIYDNPVKAGICQIASEYPFSNYKKNFANFKATNSNFIDIEEDREIICKEVVRNFFDKNKINIISLKNNKEKLNKLITILREEYGFSLRQIAKEININRETIRQIYKE